jgi:hypothetical protein
MFEVLPSSDDVSPEETEDIPISDEHDAQNILTQLTQWVPSRPLTNYDPSIEPAQRYILQRTYLEGPEEFHYHLNLIHVFAIVYGSTISHATLRQAVVLFCQLIWRDTFTGFEMEEQRRRARHALSRKLTDPKKIDEGDLLAAFFLAAYCFESGSSAEGRRHTLGFRSLMRHLLACSGTRSDAFVLRALWPFLKISLFCRCFDVVDRAYRQFLDSREACNLHAYFHHYYRDIIKEIVFEIMETELP